MSKLKPKPKRTPKAVLRLPDLARAILAQGRFEVFFAPWIALVPAAAFASGVLAFNLAI